MNSQFISRTALVALLAALIAPLAFAHGGGLDAQGCHNDRMRSEYHCHRAQGAVQSSALSERPAPTPSPSVSESPGAAGKVHRIRTFRDAKNLLRKHIYTSADNRLAFYSGCRFHAKGKKLIPDWKTCGFHPRKNANRAGRIEFEHIVPAWAIGHQLQCWQRGGRKNCSRNDAYFRMAEADLHNLVPAIGEINGDRSNYRFAELGGKFGQYGAVPMKIDFKQRAVQPPAQVKGDIARAYFYMAQTYKLRISRAQQQLFQAWNKMDPVDTWECTRNVRISEMQGNENPFISTGCLRAGL